MVATFQKRSWQSRIKHDKWIQIIFTAITRCRNGGEFFGRIFKRVVLPGNEMIAYRQCLSKCQWCCAVALLRAKGGLCRGLDGAQGAARTPRTFGNGSQWQPLAERQQAVSKRGRHWLKLSRKRYRRRKIYYNCRSQETNEYFMLCKSTWPGQGRGHRERVCRWSETHTPWHTHSVTSDISCKVYVKRCAGKEPQLSVDKSFCGEMPQE